MVGLGVNKTTRAFVNKGGSVFSPKMGDRGRPRFWANERERSRVNRYIDRHPALDRNNEEHKIKVRDMLRRQDALRVEQLSGGRASARLEETPEGKAVVALLRTEQPYGRIEVADRDRRLIGQEPPPPAPIPPDGARPKGVSTIAPRDMAAVRAVQELMNPTHRNGRAADVPLQGHSGFYSQLGVSDWLEHYLVEMFPDGLYPIQRRMLEHIQDKRWVTCEMFRSAGKSTLAAGYLIFQICQNPRGRYFLCTESQDKAQIWLRRIRNILTNNKRILTDYGNIILQSTQAVKASDSAMEFTVDRGSVPYTEPTLYAFSWQDTRTQGFHFTGGMFDDIWSIAYQTMRGAKQKFLTWWSEFQYSMDLCEWFVMLRTRKGPDDLYNDLDNMNRWHKFTHRLVPEWPPDSSYEIVENAEGWPEVRVLDQAEFDRFQLTDECRGRYEFNGLTHQGLPYHPDTNPYLLGPKYTMPKCIIAHHQNPAEFDREMQNEPYEMSGQVFKWEDVILYDPTQTAPADPYLKTFLNALAAGSERVQQVLMMDMAFGQSDQAAYTVLVLVAKMTGRYFVQDIWIGRWNFEQRLEVLRAASAAHPQAALWIESDFSQAHVIQEIKRQLPGLHIRNFTSRGQGQKSQVFFTGPNAAKLGKIYDALVTVLTGHRLYITKTLPDLEGKHGLKMQFLRFPNLQFFDQIDALAMAIIALGTGMGILFATGCGRSWR
jgi:hypothetical protein